MIALAINNECNNELHSSINQFRKSLETSISGLLEIIHSTTRGIVSGAVDQELQRLTQNTAINDFRTSLESSIQGIVKTALELAKNQTEHAVNADTQNTVSLHNVVNGENVDADAEEA